MLSLGMAHQLDALRAMNGREGFALFMEQGTGKAQPLSAKVATPEGWRFMGQIRPGDKVMCGSGVATTVKAVFPQGVKQVFKLTFDDGTETRCCEEHLWKFSDVASRRAASAGLKSTKWKVAPLREFKDQLQRNGVSVIKMPFCAPILFSKKDTPIDPYTMGILLGDGCLRNAVKFTSVDLDVVERVRQALPAGASITTSGIEHDIVGCKIWKQAIKDLGLFGCYSHEKFIPEIYATTCAPDRAELLRGLMDSDGTVERGAAVFGSSSERLAKGVADLIRSLGGRARISSRPAGTYKRADGALGPKRKGWVVRASFGPGFNPFFLKRKGDAFRPHTKYGPNSRTLKKVEEDGLESCACISVEDPSQLYITDDYIVTHNTWTFLADAERLYGAGKIDAMFIVAPNGVHTNWVLREIPTHLEVPHVAAAYSSGGGKKAQQRIERLFRPREPGEPPPMRILSMNIDAVNTKDGFALAQRFLNATRAAFIVDESSVIKNPDALRTKQLLRLRTAAVVRRIGDGTPLTKAPLDVFSQMEFLEEGLLGTTSHRAFTAEYADLHSNDDRLMRNMISKNPRAAYAQVVRRNPDGTPRWRNLDKLQRLLAPHSFRVLKKECLDLPEKIYEDVFFELTPKQRAAYDTLEKHLRIELDGEVNVVVKLAAMVKLQQITSGFVNVNGEVRLLPPEDNPRMKVLLSTLERVHGKVIVWARFVEEIQQIAAALTAAGRRVVTYYGETSKADREAAIDALQHGDAEIFVGNPQAAGVGLTLTAAETTVYYSNDFNLRTRLQSEDRNHRIGTKNAIVYIDLVAVDTQDAAIARSLQRKEDLARVVLGDHGTMDN